MNSAARSASETVHAFELAGLGRAPYRFAGQETKLHCVPGGIPRAGSSCDYCMTSIAECFWFVSADGKRFKVGCDCFFKVNSDRSLRLVVDASVRKHEAAKRKARAGKVESTLNEMCAREDVRAALAAMPHPKAASPFFASSTMLDWVEYMRAHAGAAGRARALKALTAAVRS